MRYFIYLRSSLAMLHRRVAELENKVAGLEAEKAQLQEKCFSQEIEIELTQTNTDQVGENANFSG